MGKRDPREVKCATTCEVACFFVSMVLIFGGIALFVSRFAQKNAVWRLQDDLVISEDSEMLKAWKNPKFPVLMKFYVFNVTNAEDISKGGKPILTEHGPYTYVMYSPRFDIRFENNGTVTYRNNNSLRFDATKSVGSEDDVLYHINIPVVTVAEMLETRSSTWMKKIGFYDEALQWIGKEKLIERHTVKEIIFGYDDAMLEALSDMSSIIGEGLDSTVGPFHGFNNSDDGLFLVDTGAASFNNYTAIQRWNGDTHLSCWSDNYTNMINGTDGAFLKPHVKRNESRYLYFPQMYRSAELTYERDSEYKGIETFQYHFADDLLANATAVPANKGFCVPKCYDSGLLNIGACSSVTAPIFLSLPHFYQGSQKLVDDVGGMRPNKTKHDSFFHVEPATGAVLISQRRLQINVYAGKRDIFHEMEKIKPVFFPYLWLSGEAVVSEEIASDLHKALTIIRVVAYSGVVVVVIGLILLVATFIKKQRRVSAITKAAADEELLIPSTSSSVEEA